jgi:prepilin-type N-terminal cleavage/methylation domain-containing protein
VRQAGFTLIEVMIALVLMALVGVMAERALSQMLRARAGVVAQQQRWRDIAFAFGRLGDDVGFSADALAPPGGDWRADEAGLHWTRWGQDGQLLTLDYALEAGQWRRRALAAGGARAGTAAVLLERVAAAEILLLDGQGQWQRQWPPAGGNERRPRAVSLALTLAEGGRVQRIFALP